MFTITSTRLGEQAESQQHHDGGCAHEIYCNLCRLEPDTTVTLTDGMGIVLAQRVPEFATVQ